MELEPPDKPDSAFITARRDLMQSSCLRWRNFYFSNSRACCSASKASSSSQKNFTNIPQSGFTISLMPTITSFKAIYIWFNWLPRRSVCSRSTFLGTMIMMSYYAVICIHIMIIFYFQSLLSFRCLQSHIFLWSKSLNLRLWYPISQNCSQH